METGRVIQGRFVTASDVGLIRDLLRDNPSWNRSRLSRELCERWDWRNGKGCVKDMAARTMLLKLERLGRIQLPARQRPGRPNGSGYDIPDEMDHDTTPVEDDLSRLRPLRVESIGAGDKHLPVFNYLLHRYHYLGHQRCVGENIKLMLRDHSGRLLACMLFGSAAWKTKSRDQFIGWDRSCRERNLSLLTNNTRFLILPWVRVKCLASHVLARVCAELPGYWIEKYGHSIHLLETFVERERFRGTCYRAAGWTHVGATAGRSRNDVYATMCVPVKDVFVRPLCPDFRRRLCT
jgi:hypothetical protein